MILHRNGGPAGRRNQDESYSEEEEEEDTSSTSVDNSENEDDDDGGEEEEEEEESEEDEDSDGSDEEEEEAVAKRRPTRNSGPTPGTSSAAGKKTGDQQRGRVTRQKAREEMPAKRLLRSRKKSPVAGAGSKVTQVFKCQNCKKEFNTKVSLSRHTGWCRPKGKSPRKRKSEGATSGPETPKVEEKRSATLRSLVSVMESPPAAPKGPRGRGRPRKSAVSVLLQRKKQHRHEIMHHHYHEEVLSGVAGTLAQLEEDFMQQQKSPESSPGVLDTSSEEDYEQKEFAANAHQLISHRSSSASIDVVNPDPPEVTEGPVTCPQCKMTYRTLVGYQNHLPTCAPYSSDEEEDEDTNEVGMDENPHVFQQHSNWTEHQTMHETQIAPPPPQEPIVISSEDEETTSSSDENMETEEPVPANSHVSIQQQQPSNANPPPPVVQNLVGTYQEISIAPTGVGKSPLKIILPPDNTPQVINAAGLTLERLPVSPAQKRIGAEPTQRSGTPQSGPAPPMQGSPFTSPSPPAVLSSTTSRPISSAPQQSLSHPMPTYQAIAPAAEYTHPPAVPQVSHSRSSTTSIASLSPSAGLKMTPLTTVASLLQQIHAGVNPPTYTQAQLMPGTVLHNTIMQVPQQLTTTTGEAYHLNQPVSNQFPAAQYPSVYQNQSSATTPAAQSTFRVQNAVPGMHPALPGHPVPGHPGGMFVGGTNAQTLAQQQQIQVAGQLATTQMPPRHSLPDQLRLQTPSQLSQFATQIPNLQGQQAVGGILTAAGQQHHPVFANGNSTIGPYGIPQSTPVSQMQQNQFSVTPGSQFPQTNNPQMPNNPMVFPQMMHQQPQVPHAANGLVQQPQMQIGQQQQHLQVLNGSQQTTVDSSQQFPLMQQPQQMGQQLPGSYFQNPSSSIAKLPDNMTQTHALPPQQGLFNGQQTVSAHPSGLPFPMPQSATSLPHPPHNIQQQPTVPQPGLFPQHAIPNPTSGQQLPGGPSSSTVLQQYPSHIHQANVESSSQVGEATAVQSQQQHSVIPGQPQAIATNNLNLQQHPGQVELNPQQQVQLQQQQQQFLALQQQQQLQMQQNGDTSRPTAAQPQIQPQTMQAVMVNGMLQWIKTGPPQIQVPQQQQQQQLVQQGQEQVGPSNESALPHQPPNQQPPNQQPTQNSPAPGIMQAAQPATPQVIQQLAQVTDSAGNTYLIMLPSQLQQQNGLTGNASTGNGNGTQQLLNLVPGLQGLPSHQQQLQRVQSHCTASANGLVNHSPGSSSSSAGNAFHSMGKSSPCPCASCKEKTGTASAMEKYKKVLPYPSPNDSPGSQLKAIAPNIAPKQPISIRPAIPKQPKVVRVQAAAPPPRQTLQLTLAHPPPQLPHHASQQQQLGSQQVKIVPVQQQQQLVGVAPGAGNAPITSSNIAVVRPMENPLQRLSDQISQIESTFLTPPPNAVPVTSQTPPLQTVAAPASSPQGSRLALVTASPPGVQPIPVSSASPSQLFSHVITLDPPPPIEATPTENSTQPVEVESTVLNIPMPRLTLVDHGIRPATSIASPMGSPQIASPSSSIQSISTPTTPLRNNTTNNTATTPVGVKRKVLQVSPSAGGGPSAKSIKLSLHKKENADTYSITKIEGDSQKPEGSFKSLKIKGKITKGPQKDTATNVVVVPSIRIVANPDPDQNETIAEDSQGLSPRSTDGLNCGGDNNNNGYGSRGNLRLTHKAVVMYEVRKESTNELMFQSLNVYAVWDRVFQIAQGTRLNHKLPPVSYPPTNLARPQNDTEAQSLFQRLGLTHRALDFMLQTLGQLKKSSESSDSAKALTTPLLEAAGSNNVTPPPPPLPESSTEEPHRAEGDSEEKQEIEVGSESGCARLERFAGRKCFDMFGWLTSQHRDPLTECDAPMESLKTLSAPIGMRYRKLKDKARAFLVIKKSEIHGRGLFTKRDIEKGEMIIEYAGEVIRPLVCDMREKYYESKAIGCYMFRINDHVIDATMKGNAARFINHSCEPNCEARAVKINGKHRIIIFAIKRITRGQELAYDYKFEKEEEKIICTCRSKYCRKYLN